jgi:hypothetical protein
MTQIVLLQKRIGTSCESWGSLFKNEGNAGRAMRTGAAKAGVEMTKGPVTQVVGQPQ